MRVLVAHSHYRSTAPSGEDMVFRNEVELLRSHGVEVVLYERHNDSINESDLRNKIRLAAGTVWSRQAYSDIQRILERAQPDVAHFHNTFPLISPSAYLACRRHAVPVIQTLHNYRLICAGALLLREGRPCEDCVGGSLLPALCHRCYRGSLPATSAVVSMLIFNRLRGSYRRLVNRYITLTKFAASRFVAGGLPARKIEVKSNFLPDPPECGEGRGGYAVYVGRLSAEKGLDTLVRAWKNVRGLPLKVLGEGPLRGTLEQTAQQHRSAVEFLGMKKRKTVIEVVRDAVLQVVPSQCYEGFPLVVLEAYACGTPVVASRIGSLNEIVVEDTTGLKFAPGDASALSDAVNRLIGNAGLLTSYRKRVRKFFDQNYSAAANFEDLMGIYERAATESKGAPRRRE